MTTPRRVRIKLEQPIIIALVPDASPHIFLIARISYSRRRRCHKNILSTNNRQPVKSSETMQIPQIQELHQFEIDFFKCLRIFLVVCQCCGAAPIYLSFVNFSSLSSAPTKRSYRESLKCFLHYAWCTFVLCAIIGATYIQYEQFDSENNIIMFLTRILYFSEYISGILSTAFIFVGCHYQRNRYGDYFRRFSRTFLKLGTFGADINFVETKKIINQFLFGYLAFFGCVILTDFMYNRFCLRTFFRSSAVYSLPNIIAAMALAEYFLLLNLLTQCYAEIRLILQGISSAESEPCAQIQLDIFQLELSRLHKSLLSQRPFRGHEKKVEQLRLLCLELNQLHYEITASFGLLIISTIVSAFIILSIQFYTFYTIFEGFLSKDTWLIIYTLLWTILHGGKTFLILLSNQLVQDEVNPQLHQELM